MSFSSTARSSHKKCSCSTSMVKLHLMSASRATLLWSIWRRQLSLSPLCHWLRRRMILRAEAFHKRSSSNQITGINIQSITGGKQERFLMSLPPKWYHQRTQIKLSLITWMPLMRPNTPKLSSWWGSCQDIPHNAQSNSYVILSAWILSLRGLTLWQSNRIKLIYWRHSQGILLRLFT